MKAGDTAALVGIPPNLADKGEMQTRTLFEKCLGRTFLIAAMESVEGLPYPLANLEVGHVIGEEPWKHTIWVEPEYLKLVAEAYRVFVVLDREYGERLSELARTGPVWIVDTPTNHTAAQKLWAAHGNRSHLEGVTTFKSGGDCSSEDALINELDTIDLHHGTYSADPPYTVLEVIGTRISEKLETELSRFGFDQFQATTEGFRAVRPLPSDLPPDSRGQLA